MSAASDKQVCQVRALLARAEEKLAAGEFLATGSELRSTTAPYLKRPRAAMANSIL